MAQQNKSESSEFVRQSNTMRRMTRAQVWSIVAFGSVFVLVLLFVGLG